VGADITFGQKSEYVFRIISAIEPFSLVVVAGLVTPTGQCQLSSTYLSGPWQVSCCGGCCCLEESCSSEAIPVGLTDAFSFESLHRSLDGWKFFLSD